MSMGGGSSRDKLQSDINVTPLVDVCLVLLIIFMVVTPLLQKGIAVQLPTTVGYGTPPLFYFEADRLPKEEVQKRLNELYERTPSAEIIIKADQRLKYADVKEVMKMAKEAGFQNVGLIADKKQKGMPAKG